MFFWPALVILFVGLTKRYPLRLFKDTENKSFLEHTSKVLQHLLITHTICRPVLFSFTILPSQFVTCASDRFGYVTYVSDYYSRTFPWVIAARDCFRGGCNDLFPSGHCIFTTTVVLLVARVRSGWLAIWTWAVLFFSIVHMVEKGNHYSIDAWGSVFITASIWYLIHGDLALVNCWAKPASRIQTLIGERVQNLQIDSMVSSMEIDDILENLKDKRINGLKQRRLNEGNDFKVDYLQM